MKFLIALVSMSLVWVACEGATLKINGSTTVNLPAAEAAELLRAQRKLDIQIDTNGGSSGGISALGDGLVQIAMISKELTDADRAKYPKVHFRTAKIGEDAVALIVSKDVWDGGVRSLSKQQLKDVYEGRVKNWVELGGPKQRIVFFNKEPGRGTWEVFAHWLYGDSKKAPQRSFPEVGGNEETRNKVRSTRGAMSQLSASWADGVTVFALAIKTDSGEEIAPTAANILNRKYPMSRPLYLVTDGEPTAESKIFVDFVLSPRGQALVSKHGYLTLEQLGNH
ncbi:MAG: phosphate ABC transporter substrate-binding protein [Steroidobacteraceae bacterium]